uniref:Metalloendopeptidase n=1 Tax=Acrobeloides nanus TaxID=290746 RepID=A0A914EDK4_9BILA
MMGQNLGDIFSNMNQGLLDAPKKLPPPSRKPQKPPKRSQQAEPTSFLESNDPPPQSAPSPPRVPTLFDPLQNFADSLRARQNQRSPSLRQPSRSLRQPSKGPNLLDPIQSLADSISSRQRSPSARRQQFASGGSPFGRLTNNFVQNFFPMLEELNAFTGPEALSHQSEEQKAQSEDFLSAHGIMSGYLKATSKNARQPLRPLPVLNDGTEAGRNRPLMNQLFESDILLTSRQAKAIVLAEIDKKNGHKRTKRKVIIGSVYRWPKGKPIPYSFRDPDKKWRQTIKSGLKLWEKETCIRFHENDVRKIGDQIEFFRGSGCYSSVGRVGGIQKISIGYGCEDKGIVSHEVGHSLGFWHEQSRPDRDDYIQLDDEYIAGGTEGNFAQRSDLEADGMGLPYDLASVMHYGPNAFTTDWDHYTIITKDKRYQRTIGQREGPSFIDVKQINRLYCNDVCKGAKTECHNGGYPDPNNCLKCKCPIGIGGETCDQVEPTTCGGEIIALEGWNHLTHTGKDRCIWKIKTQNARIRIILDNSKYSCETTCKNYVEIKHNSDFQQTGFRSCCEEQKTSIVSEQDEVIVISDNRGAADGGTFTLRYIRDNGTPLPKPPPPIWVPGRENRPFRGVDGKNSVIEKFILNAIPQVRDPNRPVETSLSIFTDYFASSLLGAPIRGRK